VPGARVCEEDGGGEGKNDDDDDTGNKRKRKQLTDVKDSDERLHCGGADRLRVGSLLG